MAQLRFRVKWFNELTRDELYDVLQLRAEVFVVEQECAYQDIDGKDQKALHVLAYEANQLVGYTRIFKKGDYFNQASIGRVVIVKTHRGLNYGKLLMEASIKALYDQLGKQAIKLSAQTYLIKFYNELGFHEESEGYLEDGIPHIAMVKS